MRKKITCIECPAGCAIEAHIEEDGTVSVFGDKCDKGNAYARKEMTCPERLLTSTVRAEGLEVAMIPVRTSAPVPKESIKNIMETVHAARVTGPVKSGDVVIPDVMGLGVDIIATRGAGRALDK